MIPHNQTVAPGQHVALSELFSISGSGISQYKVWFSWAGGGFPALGTLTNNGVAIPLQQEVVLPTLEGVVYTGSSKPGTEKIWLQAYNGNWSDSWTEVDITEPGAGAPVVTAARQAIDEGREVPLSTLFTVTGTDITQYRVWYSWPEGGAPALGAVKNNGVAIPTDRWVSFSSLDGLTYTGSASSGTDSMWLIADNGTLSNQVRAYVTLTTATTADAMFNQIQLTHSDLPTEMAKLARDAYPRFFESTGSDGTAVPLGVNLNTRAQTDLLDAKRARSFVHITQHIQFHERFLPSAELHRR